MPSGRPNVLVLYFNAVQPMRLAVEHHLDAFGRYASSECFPFNLARPRTPRWLRRSSFDVVVLHTSLLSLRWAPEHLRLAVDRIRGLGLTPRACLAFPQDEFIHTDLLCDSLATLGVTHVFSAAAPAQWPKIYAPLWPSTIEFRQVLTGYLDDSLLDAIRRLEPEIPTRTIDVGYRAWRAAPSLGRLGRQKVEIAERFLALNGVGLTMDVSTRDSDVLLGDDWLRFLLHCRAVLGTESGASILDRTGELHDAVSRYQRDHPQASFDEVEAACFPGADGSLDLRVISPRHLEACATRTCQVLMRGDYSGILDAGVHYVPVEPDYGNLDTVVATVNDAARCAEIAERAHRDVVASGRWSYRRFVADTLDRVSADLATAGLATAARPPTRSDLWVARRDDGWHRARLAFRCRVARRLSAGLARMGIRVSGETLAQVPVVASRVARGQQRLSRARLADAVRRERAST